MQESIGRRLDRRSNNEGLDSLFPLFLNTDLGFAEGRMDLLEGGEVDVGVGVDVDGRDEEGLRGRGRGGEGERERRGRDVGRSIDVM